MPRVRHGPRGIRILPAIIGRVHPVTQMEP